MIALFLRTRARRIAALLGFALLFLLSALTARMLTGTEHGQVEVGNLYLIGGYPLVSALLLLGWLIGRYPLLAILVLMSGVVASDRANGTMRLYGARPTSLSRLYFIKFLVALATAFILSAVLLPAFDLLLLSRWAGPNTFVLILSYVLVYGSLIFFLSVWLRGDVWVALALAIIAMIWDAMQRSGRLAASAPGVREIVSILLPPQSALFQIENAYGAETAMPWGAVVYVVAYATIVTVAALASLRLREF